MATSIPTVRSEYTSCMKNYISDEKKCQEAVKEYTQCLNTNMKTKTASCRDLRKNVEPCFRQEIKLSNFSTFVTQHIWCQKEAARAGSFNRYVTCLQSGEKADVCAAK